MPGIDIQDVFIAEDDEINKNWFRGTFVSCKQFGSFAKSVGYKILLDGVPNAGQFEGNPGVLEFSIFVPHEIEAPVWQEGELLAIYASVKGKRSAGDMERVWINLNIESLSHIVPEGPADTRLERERKPVAAEKPAQKTYESESPKSDTDEEIPW